MNFSQRQADPRRHLVGLAFVIVLHVAIVYALVTGLAKKVIDVVRTPIEIKVIEEARKPPPAPQTVLPPPPKLEAPPPPFIPPPEILIAVPPPPAPAITAVAPEPPPKPVVVAPAPPPPAPPPPAPPPPAPPPPAPVPPPPAPPMSIGVACTTQVPPSMPIRAMRNGITGSVRALATIRGGKVVNVEILSASPRGVFEAAVKEAMMQYGCQSTGGVEIKAEQRFDFKME